MNMLDVLRGLLRRWYITVPGILVACVAASAIWLVTPSEYERTASQLLLPGEGGIPEDASNQYLYLGGLAPVADVLTRAVSGDEVVQRYRSEGAEITISRDGSVSGPLIVVTATADTDALAEEIVSTVTMRATSTLDRLQADQDVPKSDRVTISTIAMDRESRVIERTRLVITAAAGLAAALLALVIASAVDGLAQRRRRRGRPQRDAHAEYPPDGLDPAVEDDLAEDEGLADEAASRGEELPAAAPARGGRGGVDGTQEVPGDADDSTAGEAPAPGDADDLAEELAELNRSTKLARPGKVPRR